jgi:hypothetical protein
MDTYIYLCVYLCSPTFFTCLLPATAVTRDLCVTQHVATPGIRTKRGRSGTEHLRRVSCQFFLLLFKGRRKVTLRASQCFSQSFCVCFRSSLTSKLLCFVTRRLWRASSIVCWICACVCVCVWFSFSPKGLLLKWICEQKKEQVLPLTVFFWFCVFHASPLLPFLFLFFTRQ